MFKTLVPLVLLVSNFCFAETDYFDFLRPLAIGARSSANNGNLTSVTVSSNKIVLSIYDNDTVDGDRVRILFNKNEIKENLELTKTQYKINLNLVLGENIVRFFSIDDGTAPPNTATLVISKVIKGKKRQNWYLRQGQFADLRIVYEK